MEKSFEGQLDKQTQSPEQQLEMAQVVNVIHLSIKGTGNTVNCPPGPIVVTISQTPKIILPGSIVTLTGSVTPSAAIQAYTYAWFFDGRLLPGETTNILTISNVNQSNVGTYTLQATEHCTDPAESGEGSIKLHLTHIPVPTEVIEANMVFDHVISVSNLHTSITLNDDNK